VPTHEIINPREVPQNEKPKALQPAKSSSKAHISILGTSLSGWSVAPRQ
jgi:hypothetical protein